MPVSLKRRTAPASSVARNTCREREPEKMLYSGTDPESYITEYTLVYEDKKNYFELRM